MFKENLLENEVGEKWMTPLVAVGEAGETWAFDWIDKVHKTIRKYFMRICLRSLLKIINES